MTKWQDQVNAMQGVEIPKARFRQLVYFLVGLGAVRRSQMTLFMR